MILSVRDPSRVVLRLFVVALVLSTAGFAGETSQVFQPGTQPEEGGIEFARVKQCAMCHAGTSAGEADPYFSWQGGMMAQAARDPVFRAALTVANQDIEGVGEYCLRCHTPRAWLEGRSTPTDGSALNEEDMHGVSCDICHRLVDPLSAEAEKLAEDVPPGYGNAMMVADPANVVRGPYGDGKGAMPHDVLKSPYHASSELCGLCHNVSNPLQTEDIRTRPPYAYGPIERTYSEWKLSAFASGDSVETCQSCHYEPVAGGGQPSRFGGPKRPHFVRHGPVGGSTWVQDTLPIIWGTKALSRKALEAGKKRTRTLLGTAATLEVSFPMEGRATLRITNNTGHKLPTGYPEGRRMWVQVQLFDVRGQVLDEIGRYGEKEDTLLGEAVTVPTLLDVAPKGERVSRTRVYECLPGISREAASRFGKESGPSFHFVLNDVITKDNRIPPKGFTNESYKEHGCAPVGASYADGQHWDELDFEVPPDTAKVVARLLYQSVSWEYIKFLVEENRTDEWGRKLHDAWRETGYCAPEVIAEVSVPVRR